MRIGIFAVTDHYPQELPRTVGTLYAELLEQAEYADTLGFDSFWVAEHHFHEYGAIPRPAVFLAAAAQRTRRIRLGSAVAVLPFDNPLRVAEDYAMVDVLSGGRLNLGVGSGYLRHEFEGFAVPFAEKRSRFDESLAIIRQAFRGERFSFSGKYFQVPEVQLNVAPIQRERVPIWIAALGREVVPHIGARRLPALLIPYAKTSDVTELAEDAQAYLAAFAAASDQPAEPALGFGLHAYCGEDSQRALADIAEPMARYVRTRLYAQHRELSLLRERSLVAVGDPEELTQVLRRYQAMGMALALLITSFGGLPHAQVLRSMELVARHVLPRFHQHSAEAPPSGSLKRS